MFNTPEQVRTYLLAALDLVNELDAPDDLRPVMFRAAFDGLSGKHVGLVQEPTIQLDSILTNGRR